MFGDKFPIHIGILYTLVCEVGRANFVPLYFRASQQQQQQQLQQPTSRPPPKEEERVI